MSTFLLEIGLEEIPAHLVTSAESQLVELTQHFLNDHRLEVESIKPYSTPRRLAVQLIGVADSSKSLSEEKRGPSIERAKDANGEWSKAAQGFARGQQANTSDFEERDGYVWLTKRTPGVDANVILEKIGEEVIKKMKFTTYMKWANHSFLYVRPIRWIVALLDSKIIEFTILDVSSGRITRGHRFLSTDHIKIENADEYQTTLSNAYVIADALERKEKIVSQLKNIALDSNWVLTLDNQPAQELLEEVNNIVEWPTAFAGDFDEKYLEIPDEVLITSMREHQRFFFVTNQSGELLPHFLSVRNGDENNITNVVAGNEKVLVARLEDAEFFYREDQQKSIEDYMTKIKSLIFHEKIGTVEEHMLRVGHLSINIAKTLKFSSVAQENLQRASEIYKFDLMTGMVGEFDELQGIMGEHYAQKFGENQQVALAIKEHYMPKSAISETATSDIGAVLAIADKIDTIVTFFSAGLIPSGSNDPYGLRRAATGVVRTIKAKGWNLDLKPLISQFIEQSGAVANEANVSDILTFILDRVRKLAVDAGMRQDIIAAGSANAGKVNILYIFDRIATLSEHQNDKDFRSIIESLTRVARLAKKEPVTQSINPDLFENASESKLYKAVETLEDSMAISEGTDVLYESLATLQDPITEYFDTTMVNDENVDVRLNRYAQLNQINNLIEQLGDLELIVIK